MAMDDAGPRMTVEAFERIEQGWVVDHAGGLCVSTISKLGDESQHIIGSIFLDPFGRTLALK